MSLDDDPNFTLKEPFTMDQACFVASQIEKSRGFSIRVTFSLSPAASIFVLRKPLSCKGGSPADCGKPKYSWETSAPLTAPLFLITKDPSCWVIDKPLYSN